jgi:hypothetical protein
VPLATFATGFVEGKNPIEQFLQGSEKKAEERR